MTSEEPTLTARGSGRFENGTYGPRGPHRRSGTVGRSRWSLQKETVGCGGRSGCDKMQCLLTCPAKEVPPLDSTTYGGCSERKLELYSLRDFRLSNARLASRRRSIDLAMGHLSRRFRPAAQLLAPQSDRPLGCTFLSVPARTRCSSARKPSD